MLCSNLFSELSPIGICAQLYLLFFLLVAFCFLKQIPARLLFIVTGAESSIQLTENKSTAAEIETEGWTVRDREREDLLKYHTD